MVNQLIAKIKEMEQQRTQQTELLHKELDEDDITGKLAGEPEMIHSEIFEREIKKHDKRIGYLRQNLAAQGNILSVLDDAQVNYAHVYRKKRESNQLYDEKIGHLVKAAQHSDQIIKKLVNGQELLKTLTMELRKVGGALDAASGMRRSMMKQFITPARPNKPKPEKTKSPKINPELEAELKALGLDDDAEFLAFLAQSDMDGDLVQATKSTTVPAHVPSLPGIPKSRVAAAMNRPPQPRHPVIPPNSHAQQPTGFAPNVPMMHAPRPAAVPPPGQKTPSAVEQYYANMAKYRQAPDSTQSTQFHNSVQPTSQQQFSQQGQQPTQHQPRAPQPQVQHSQIQQPPIQQAPIQQPQVQQPPIQQHQSPQPQVQQPMPNQPPHSAPTVSVAPGVAPNVSLAPSPDQTAIHQERQRMESTNIELQRRQQQQSMHEQQLRQQQLQLQQKEEYLRKQQQEFEQRQLQIQQQQAEAYKKQQSELQKQSEHQQMYLKQQQHQQQQKIQQQQQQDYQRQQLEHQRIMQQKQQLELEKQNIIRNQQLKNQELDRQKQWEKQELDRLKQWEKQEVERRNQWHHQEQERLKQHQIAKEKQAQQHQVKHQQDLDQQNRLQNQPKNIPQARQNQPQPHITQQQPNVPKSNFGGEDYSWLMKYRQPTTTSPKVGQPPPPVQSANGVPVQPHVQRSPVQQPTKFAFPKPTAQQPPLQPASSGYRPPVSGYGAASVVSQPHAQQRHVNGTPPRSTTPLQMTPPPRYYSPKPLQSSNQFNVPANLPPPLLPNSSMTSNVDKPAPVKSEPAQPKVQTKPVVIKPSSNFALLSDFASIPKIASNQPQHVQPTQNGTQSILDRVNQMSQQQQVLKMNSVDPSIITSIQNSAFPPDQLRNKNRTHAAARCCSSKNRQQSSIPFDDNRVKLQNVSNDYINCSRITTNMAEIPTALVSETPLPENHDDVWRMIWDEQIELGVFICSQEEMADSRLVSWHSRQTSKHYPSMGLAVESKLSSVEGNISTFTIVLSKGVQKVRI